MSKVSPIYEVLSEPEVKEFGLQKGGRFYRHTSSGDVLGANGGLVIRGDGPSSHPQSPGWIGRTASGGELPPVAFTVEHEEAA